MSLSVAVSVKRGLYLAGFYHSRKGRDGSSSGEMNNMESGKSSSSIKQFFTNRVQNIDVFNRLNHLPGQSNHIAVLVFYGISGIGKSYLLRNLYEASQARTNIQPHGYAQISFSRGQLVTESSQALWDLRGQLHASVKEALFERFDLFWGIMWERTHHLPIRENKELSQGDLKWSPTISDAVEFIGSFITIPLVVPLFKKVVDLGAQAFGDLRHRAIVTKISTWFEQHPKAPRGIPLKGFLKKASVDQLVEWLPRCFAADLADVSLECPLTLFIDGYEILQAQTSQQFGSGSATFIQILAEELARTKARVLLVIGGADHLRWTEIQRSDGTWVPRKDSVWKSSASQNPSVEQHQLANFSKADALAYLAQRRVPAEQAREIYQILGGYPLALSIAADLLEVGNQGSIEKLDFANLVAQVSGFEPLSLEWRSQVEEWLLNKLLEQLDANGQNGLKSLVRLAAIPRWFNEALLWELANTYTFQDDFQRLINYSFVKPVLEQPGWWRLDWHARRFLLDTIHIPSQRITWEERARTWFKNQSSQSTGKNWQVFELEALYHLWQIDPPQALLTVDELFQNPEMSQLEFRWDILATASEAESILPPI
jgi:hypothetical protein